MSGACRPDRAPGFRHGLLAAFATFWRAALGDAGVLTMLFGAPLLYAFFYPLPYERQVVEQVPIAIVDQDRSALSQQLVRFAKAHPRLTVREVMPDLGSAQDRLWRNEVAGVMIIPSGLARDVLAGRPVVVTLAGDGGYLLLNKVVVGAMTEVAGTLSAGIEIRRLQAGTSSPDQARRQRQPVDVNGVALYNTYEGYGSYIVPGVAVLIIQQTLLIGVGMVFGMRAERGDPPLVPSAGGWLGAWLAVALVPLLTCAFYFGFVMWLQDYPRGGNGGGLMLFTVVFAFTLAATALMLGLLFRSRERSALLLIGLSMPMLFVSGFSWPVEAMPAPLQTLRWLLPSTPGIQGMVALNQLGASVGEVLPELLALMVQMAVYGAIAAWQWQGDQRLPQPAGARAGSLGLD